MLKLFHQQILKFSQYHSNTSIIEVFKSRNLYYQSNSQQLQKKQFFSTNFGKSVYCGYDPTSSSLHLGNLVSILMLARLNLYGMKPIFLIGGATGLIGDPSGKNKQRQLLEIQAVHKNLSCLQKQIANVFTNIKNNLKINASKYNIDSSKLQNLNKFNFQIVNNYQFYQNINFIDFLRNIGKNFRMGPLLSKEMVVRRLQSEEGISFTEFAYSLMQGYDYSKLYQNKNCVLQIGGSDQWGNILNGTQLIKKKLSKQAYAITMPLLLTKSGAKFGKSQGNALFLNSEMTPLKQVYQYLYNTNDEDLEKYLSIFTFFQKQKIKEIIKQHQGQKQKRKGQQILAQQVVNFLGQYKHIDKQFFTLTHEQLVSKSIQYLRDLFQNKKVSDPGSYIKIQQSKLSMMHQLADFLVETNVTKSKKQVRRQVEAGGLYINNQRVTKQQSQRGEIGNVQKLLKKKILYEKFIILRWGKKKYYFIQLI